MKYNIGKYKERDIYINECIEIVDSLTKNISQILSVHSIENLNKLSTGYSFCAKQGRNVKDLS